MTHLLGNTLRHTLLLVCLAFLLGCDRSAPSFHATDITGADFGRLTVLERFMTHEGHPVVINDFSGKVIVTFFGYAQCPDICPTTLATLKQAMALLGPAADRVQVLFITLDPDRDTPEVLAPYVTWFDPRFKALRGDPDATLAAAKEFRVFFSKVSGGSALGYSIDHSAVSFAHDTQGRLRLMFRHDAPIESIASDLKKLLAG